MDPTVERLEDYYRKLLDFQLQKDLNQITSSDFSERKEGLEDVLSGIKRSQRRKTVVQVLGGMLYDKLGGMNSDLVTRLIEKINNPEISCFYTLDKSKDEFLQKLAQNGGLSSTQRAYDLLGSRMNLLQAIQNDPDLVEQISQKEYKKMSEVWWEIVKCYNPREEWRGVWGIVDRAIYEKIKVDLRSVGDLSTIGLFVTHKAFNPDARDVHGRKDEEMGGYAVLRNANLALTPYAKIVDGGQEFEALYGGKSEELRAALKKISGKINSVLAGHGYSMKDARGKSVFRIGKAEYGAILADRDDESLKPFVDHWGSTSKVNRDLIPDDLVVRVRRDEKGKFLEVVDGVDIRHIREENKIGERYLPVVVYVLNRMIQEYSQASKRSKF